MAIPLIVAFLLAAAGAFAGPLPPPPPLVAGTSCPTNIPAVTTTIVENFEGSTAAFEWTISLTSPVNQPPEDATACATAGYISQYTPGAGCGIVLARAPYVYQDGPLCVYAFFDGISTYATISLQCNAAATSLELTPVVPVTPHSGFLYAFTGSYAGVCQASPETSTYAPPQPTPAPTPYEGPCPAYIPAITTTIIQSYNGVNTPYEWTISLTSAVNQPPEDAAACTTAGYLSQYTPGAGCEAALTQTYPVLYEDGPLCIYAFDDGLATYATVNLQCNASATSLELNPVVPYYQNGDSYVYNFTGSYAGVCTNADAKQSAQVKAVHAFGRKHAQVQKP